MFWVKTISSSSAPKNRATRWRAPSWASVARMASSYTPRWGVGIVFLVVMQHGIQHLLGVLGGGGAVQIDQPIAVFISGQNGGNLSPKGCSVWSACLIQPPCCFGAYFLPQSFQRDLFNGGGQSGRPPSGGGPGPRSSHGSADSRVLLRPSGQWRPRAGPRLLPLRRGSGERCGCGRGG